MTLTQPVFESVIGAGAMINWIAVVIASTLTLYEDWYNFQHLPERVSTPGFLRARRFAATGTPKKNEPDRFDFLTLYETHRPVDVLASVGIPAAIWNNPHRPHPGGGPVVRSNFGASACHASPPWSAATGPRGASCWSRSIPSRIPQRSELDALADNVFPSSSSPSTGCGWRPRSTNRTPPSATQEVPPRRGGRRPSPSGHRRRCGDRRVAQQRRRTRTSSSPICRAGRTRRCRLVPMAHREPLRADLRTAFRAGASLTGHASNENPRLHTTGRSRHADSQPPTIGWYCWVRTVAPSTWHTASDGTFGPDPQSAFDDWPGFLRCGRATFARSRST